MERDFRKLSLWLEKVCREQVALEQKQLEWKLSERANPAPPLPTKAE